MAQSADIQSLDPWTATDDPTITALRQIYEGLVDLEPGGFKIVPKLADSWTVSTDARVWTFHLHPGVTFHDGTAFDAQSVATNFGRANAVARFGVGALISSVQVPDPATVVITLRSGYAPFLSSLASGSFGIVNPVCLKLADWATAATACAQGTGPFVVRPGAWRTGESVTLQRNPAYWARDADGRALPYVDTLVFRAIRDDAARVAELRAATISIVIDPVPSSLIAVRSDPNLAIRRRPSYDVSYVGIGGGTKQLESVDVRRAIAMAIDRGAIVQTVYAGDARAAAQLLPPGFPGYDDTISEFTKYDTGASKKLLADAGSPNGFATELWYVPAPRPALPDPKRVAEAIAADLGKIGITTTLRTVDALTLETLSRAGSLPLWIGQRTAERADPADFFDGVSSDPIANELLRRASSEPDASKRSELYKQVTKMFLQQIPRIPLFHASAALALTRKLPGLIPQPIVGESFAGVWIGR